MKSFALLLIVGLTASVAAAAEPPATNVWQVAGASSCSFEFRFTHPKGQIQLWRKCETTGKPRTRIFSTLSLLPFCARCWVWDCERGTHAWQGNQLNLGEFGCGNSFETNVWYRARYVQRENASVLLVDWAGAWREMMFSAFKWPTTRTALELTPGKAEVRNLKVAPARGRARLATLEPDGQDVVAEFATGYGRALVKLDYADGSHRWTYVTPSAQKYYCTRRENGAEKWYERECRDCRLQFSDPSFSIFSPARAWAYRPSERAAAIDYAETHPGECAQNRRVKLRYAADGTFWVDGKFMGGVTNSLAKVSLYVPEVAPKGERLYAVPPTAATDVLTLDPADCTGAKRTDEGRAYLDISEHREHSDPGQETDHYFDRDGHDGFRDSFVWSVPNRCWATARIVAAVKPDAFTNDVPIVTVRLAQQGFAGYGNACAEGQVDLAKAPKTPAGTATVGGVKVPLYACDVKIPVGDIQDRLYVKRGETKLGKLPVLYVDVVGPLGRPGILWDRSHKPDWRQRSSALVFGLTLVESPCEMELLQSQPGLIFGDDEPRTTDVRVKANKKGAYKVAGTIRDWWEKKVRSFEIPVTLAAGEEKRIPIDLKMPEEGWYELELSLYDCGGRGATALPKTESSTSQLLLSHRASFADVGRDTRKAGYESPYAWWWHGSYHGGTADVDIMGPIWRKAGVRRVNAGDGSSTEATMAKYGMTLSQIPFNIQLAMGPKPLDQKVKEYEAWLRKILGDYPHVERRALVFHESYCRGGNPYYLWGTEDRKWKESDFAEAKKRVEVGVALCKMIREKFPGMKIQLGNSSTSYDILDALFRQKFPSELFDKLGSETVARFTMPDLPISASGPNSLWFLNCVADHYGYPQRADICYEWACHLPRELGWRDGAEWSVRDKLLGLANGGTLMPAAGCTPDDAYFNSDYGGVSTVDRYPYLYPTRGYVALATMTKELDCATFSRKLETGSQTVTALEFTRKDGPVTYALWVPRGTAAVKLVGRGLFGRETAVRPVRTVRADAKRQTSAEISLSTLPVFVTTEKPLLRAEVVGRAVPGAVEPRNFQLADALVEASHVEALVITNRPEKAYFAEKRPFVHGRYSVRQGRDCVELVRDATAPAPVALVPELGYFAFRNPVALGGEPASVSIEVDGNSSWAELIFVFEDAKGVRHYETGIAYEGDGKALRRVNFDGWGTMQMPLTPKSRVRSSEVVPGGDDWRTSVHGRKHEDLAYPVKIVGLAVLMPRETLIGGRCEKLAKDPNVLRIRNLGMFE